MSCHRRTTGFGWAGRCCTLFLANANENAFSIDLGPFHDHRDGSASEWVRSRSALDSGKRVDQDRTQSRRRSRFAAVPSLIDWYMLLFGRRNV